MIAALDARTPARGSFARAARRPHGERLGPDETLSVVLFQVGPRRCALPVESVRAVVLPRPVDGAAGLTHASLVGVVRDGGAVIPVVDARRWMGVADAPVAPKPRWIVAHRAGRRVALVVDAVERVCRAAVADAAPGAERARVSRYLAVQGALCAEPDLAAMAAVADARGA